MSTKNKSQLQQELRNLEAQKAELLNKKKANLKEWTKEQQAQLDALTESAVDLEEQIELAEEADTYVPKPGTENLIHLSIVRGRRFNPDTGKEESVPYIQTFNLSEYNAFVKNAPLLGYTIISELYNPFKK